MEGLIAAPEPLGRAYPPAAGIALRVVELHSEVKAYQYDIQIDA